MAKAEIVLGELSGGGAKTVTKPFRYATADTLQTFTVDELTQIDEVIVYYIDSQYNTYAVRLEGANYITPCTTNPSRNTITDISGNTFTMKWQSANDFTYIAVQNA